MYQFLSIFILFLFCSFIGWVVEVINCLIHEKKFVNRGFLVGPYLPIWGIGALLISFIGTPYSHDIISLFLVIVFLSSGLEYITSYLLEKIFHARWWDYSTNFLNIDGRVCLMNSIYFGIIGVLYLKYIEPILITYIQYIPLDIFYVLASPLFVFFIVDIIVSFKLTFHLRKTFTSLRKDYTSEISLKIKKKLSTQSKSFKRILQAFPHVQLIGNGKKRRFFFKK